MLEFRRILVPIDFSETSAAALDAAIDLAKRLGAELHLVHVYPVHPLPWPYGTPLPATLDRDLREAAQRLISEWSGKATAAGVAVSEHVVPGNAAAEGIAEQASALGADLIVIGTHGRSGLPHVLLGSVAERTIQRAACPVLAVKAPASS